MAERSVPNRRRLLVSLALLVGMVAAFSAARVAGGAPDGDIAAPLPDRLLQSLAGDSIPRLRLEIKPKHLAKIEAKRDQALERKFLSSSDDDYVPARLRYGDREVKVRVRLKGDSRDRLRGDKWSYRVVVRGGQSVLGMRRFSLEAPDERSQRVEPLFLDFLRTQEVLAPRHFYVDLDWANALWFAAAK